VNKLSEKPIVVEALVEGGKASGGPPIGPSLGPTGVNIFQVVTKINEITEPFAGLKVPVKEVGVSKGSGEPNTNIIGNLTVDQVKIIAKGKESALSAQTMKAAVMIVTGSCGQMGVTIEGKTPRRHMGCPVGRTIEGVILHVV